MSTKGGQGIGLALVGLLGFLCGSTPALAQALDVRTDRGCGSQAVYQNGEVTRFFVSSSQTVNGLLTLAKPDGTTLTLANQTLMGGMYVFTDLARRSPDPHFDVSVDFPAELATPVLNRFGQDCLSCHAQAEPQFDLVCERDHGCDPIPLTDQLILALQQGDARP